DKSRRYRHARGRGHNRHVRDRRSHRPGSGAARGGGSAIGAAEPVGSDFRGQGGPVTGKRFIRQLVLLWALLAGVWVPSPAQAQGTPVPPPPVRSTVDQNGIDLTSGRLLLSRTDVA